MTEKNTPTATPFTQRFPDTGSPHIILILYLARVREKDNRAKPGHHKRHTHRLTPPPAQAHAEKFLNQAKLSGICENITILF